MASTKILVVEDDQDVIDLLTLHFRKAGYALGTATNVRVIAITPADCWK